MKKISLQWRLTCIITLYIAVICGCLTLLVYKNGIYYIDSLQETVDARGDDAGDQGGDSATDGSAVSLPILSVAMHFGPFVSSLKKLRRCRHRIWPIRELKKTK